ncbi:Nitrogen permease regulator 2 [Entomortierella chlamydospora]|uniref:Nitrogen permease regulator 2 n=1 Tax=Entomortierella chlamydospora TaxID=101097 RepID=A0A9P6MYJ3_9FUNG|nr:Nitrogen permease regulator 2 [Entomortierella chlamydospora]
MGFPRLLSIFYCTFHPIQGPKVLYEVPEGSILSKTSPLVDFDSISEYLIPKAELCSKLVTISTPTCKVIGFPINLEHKKFERNALMFNLAFVFDKDAETSSYEPVVRKMAKVLEALEKENEFLSRQTGAAMASSVTPTNTVAPNSMMPAVPTSRGSIGGTLVQDTSQANGSSNGILDAISDANSNISISDPNASNSVPGQTQGVAETSTPSTPSVSSTLSVPTDSTSVASTSPLATPPSTLPTTQVTSTNILSTMLVSSPPSIVSSAAAPLLVAPPSSSPSPPSKPVLSPSVTGYINQGQVNGSGMQNLIEQLIEDLNSYCECQIPIDSANTINLKLFPTYPNPPPVYDYQVPISTVNLEALADVNWDMTMQRITGYINGVSSVKRIAEYADVETGLARMCMQHLLYYGCIIMVDLFQFKNIYAVKLEMMRLTEDVSLQNECVSYVTLPDMHAPSFAKIFSLYCSLQYGVVLQDWIEQNQIADYNIDVRRFISFGVIKGFLYRVHKYPILDYCDPVTAGTPNAKPLSERQQPITAAGLAAAPIPGGTSRPGTPMALAQTQKKNYGDTQAPADQNAHNPYQHNDRHNEPSSVATGFTIPPALERMLNGEHHYDELCTMFGCSVRELDLILATDSRIKFIYR